jgi:hypothetical protein
LTSPSANPPPCHLRQRQGDEEPQRGRLTGFVTKDGVSWCLTRPSHLLLRPDGRSNKAEMFSLDASTVGSWVTDTGTWIPEGKFGSDEAWPPVLGGVSGNQVKQLENSYKKR